MQLLRWSLVVALGVGAVGVARAGDAKQTDLKKADPSTRAKDAIESEFGNIANAYGVGTPPEGRRPPRVAIADDLELAPDSFDTIMGPWGHHANVEQEVVGLSADGKAGWIAAETTFWDLCGMQECQHAPPVATAHGAALYEDSAHGWQPVAWDFARVLSAREEAAARKRPAPAIARKIDPDAQDVAKQFEADLATAAALAKAISDRPDVVLYGSASKERFVGAAAVRARLLKWKLGYKVRDGVLAGLTSNKAAAWLVSNVDAAKPGDKASTAYRLFAIYEKAPSGWRIVQLTFAVPSKR
jgi:ketosteroid isomerase-like protein